MEFPTREGKMANLVVLDKDIFAIPADEIGSIDPVAVMFEGEFIKEKEM